MEIGGLVKKGEGQGLVDLPVDAAALGDCDQTVLACIPRGCSVWGSGHDKKGTQAGGSAL